MMKQLFFLQVVLPYVMSTGWSVTIPRQIRALSGDCVVIPCRYTLPESDRSKMKRILWYQEETQEIIFPNKQTSLADNLEVGNCSLWIRDITREHSKVYRFLIEVNGVRNYSSPSSVDLRVSGTAEAPELQVNSKNIMEGDTMIMTCSTNHTCNMRPPSLVWNKVLGEISPKAVDLENGIWQFVSTQIIRASVSHHGLTVHCQTKYMKVQTSPRSRSYTINVLYSPKNTTVTIINAGEIREGENVSVRCSSRSNPEVSQYIWNGLTNDGTLISLTGNQTTILISNITSNMRSVYCTAQNKIGIQISPAAELNITYKPQISPQSYCRPTFMIMECNCIVKANPPPFVTWRLMNSSITKSEEGYEVITSFSDHVTKSLLKGPTSSLTAVTCYSENKLGAEELLLPVYLDITKYLVIAGGVGIAVLLLVGVTLKLLLGSRKSAKEEKKIKDRVITRNQYLDCQPHSLKGNTESYSLYGNTESHSLYGNTESHSLYGNTESHCLYGNTESQCLYGNIECAMKANEEADYTSEPNNLYSMYECPKYEEEPVSFEKEFDSFEEESVYANT
ncbi:myelin-associated glycoprotein-like [Aquarana catesbeiana]|uniref:myelin-associated glycoprotein-like n=1 Tax=Aquarana catesbeiana TaxID=8400 RepID=UPI003CCA3717